MPLEHMARWPDHSTGQNHAGGERNCGGGNQNTATHGEKAKGEREDTYTLSRRGVLGLGVLTERRNDDGRGGGRRFVREMAAAQLGYRHGRAPVELPVNKQRPRDGGSVLKLLDGTWTVKG